MTRLSVLEPLTFELDDRHGRLRIATKTRYDWYRLGHLPQNDIYITMTEIMVEAILGYRLLPDLVAVTANHLRPEIKKGVRHWTAQEFRELLESVRVTVGLNDLREGALR